MPFCGPIGQNFVEECLTFGAMFLSFDESEAPQHGDGAPIDLQAGAHINRIYGEIKEMRKEMVEQGKAIARIEGKLSEQASEKTNSTNWKNTIVVSAATFVSAVISAVLLLKR